MLSIITLTFNNYHQLVETLNSIPNDNSVESVVVNGGQCIDTLNYLKSHKGKVISEKDDGISDAFNKGIYASTAEFIMILNSGDVLLNKDYLFRAERILKENCNVFFVHSNIIFEERYAGSLTMYPKMKNIGRGMPYLTETIVIKRSVFDLVGLYRNDYKFSMDYDLIVRMEKLGMKGQYLNEAPVVKVDGKGVSNTYEIKTMTETVKSLWENRHFNFSIVANLFVRIALFISRKLTIKIGAKNLFIKLMKWKYNRAFLLFALIYFLDQVSLLGDIFVNLLSF